MKHPVISLVLHRKNFMMVGGEQISPKLPEGCVGIIFAFESKKAAREFDKKADLVRIERLDPPKQNT